MYTKNYLKEAMNDSSIEVLEIWYLFSWVYICKLILMPGRLGALFKYFTALDCKDK